MARNTTVNLVSEKGRKLTAEEHDETIGNLKQTADEAHDLASAALPANGTALDSAKLQGKIPGTSIGNIVVQGDRYINHNLIALNSFTEEAIFSTSESHGVVGIESVQVPFGFQCQVVFEGMIQRVSASKYEKIYIGIMFGVTSGGQHYCDSIMKSIKDIPFQIYTDMGRIFKLVFDLTHFRYVRGVFRTLQGVASHIQDLWSKTTDITGFTKITPANTKSLMNVGDYGIGEDTGQGLSTGFSKMTASDGAIIFRSSGDRTFFLYGLGATGELRLDTYQGASIYGTRIMIDNQTAQTMSNKSFGTAMMPASNNAIDIGSASVRTRDIFTVNAVNVLSNAQHKQDVRSMTAQELACAQELAQNISLFRWKDAVAEKGENARIHIGMIAQEVVTIFLKHGLCANDYGLLCFDSWVAETVEHEAEYEQIEIPAVTEVRLISEAVLDKDGNEQEPAVYEIVELEPARIEQGELIAEAWTETVKDAGEAYSLRTEELLYFIMAGQEARMKNIEERLTLLE